MSNLEMRVVTQLELDKSRACDECGEHGRVKGLLSVHRAVRLYCHDEEKSCFNYLLMRAKVGILRVG